MVATKTNSWTWCSFKFYNCDFSYILGSTLLTNAGLSAIASGRSRCRGSYHWFWWCYLSGSKPGPGTSRSIYNKFIQNYKLHSCSLTRLFRIKNCFCRLFLIGRVEYGPLLNALCTDPALRSKYSQLCRLPIKESQRNLNNKKLQNNKILHKISSV